MRNHRNNLFVATLFGSILMPGIVWGMETNDKENVIIKTIETHLKTQAPNPLSPIFEAEDTIKTRCQPPTERSSQSASFASIDAKPVPERGGERKGRQKQEGEPRDRVQKPTIWPASAHGVVFMQFQDTSGLEYGTGILISPYLVLTAAHNVYDYNCHTKKIREVQSVWFAPGMNGNLQPFQQVKVKQWYFPQEYKESRKKDGHIDDYALLALEEPIGEKAGYFGLHIASDEDITQLRVKLRGYPCDKCVNQQYEMWEMDGQIDSFDNNFISYPIQTECGNSGGGLFYENMAEYYIVAIHVLSKYGDNLPQGTRITKARYDNLRRWAEESILDKLKEGIGALQNINVLSLKGLYIEDFGVQKLFELYGNFLNQLTHLDLSSNTISDKGAQLISQWLAKNTMLTTLNLANNQISGNSWLRQELGSSHLTQLDLSGCFNLTHGIFPFLALNFPNLRVLNLSNLPNLRWVATADWYNINYGPVVFEHLYELCINDCPALEAIDLDAPKLKILRNRETKKLKLLKIKSQMSDNNLYEFLQTLEAPNLKKSQVSFTNYAEWGGITKQGKEVLSLFLPTQHEQNVNMSYRNFDKPAIKAIMQALKINTTLRSLDLHGNSIGDEGAEMIAQVLETNTTITYLHLANCGIGNVGAEAMTKAFGKNTTLTTILLGNNKFDRARKELLLEKCSSNLTIFGIYL